MTHSTVRGLAAMVAVSAIIWTLIGLVLVGGPWGPLVAIAACHAGALLVIMVLHFERVKP